MRVRPGPYDGAERGWGPRFGEEAGTPRAASASLRLPRRFDAAPAGLTTR